MLSRIINKQKTFNDLIKSNYNTGVINKEKKVLKYTVNLREVNIKTLHILHVQVNNY